MELFAFRESGPYIVNELTKESKALFYLFDAVFSLNPFNYVSNMFLSAAIYNRFFTPQLHLLSKIDLLQKEKVDQITDWSNDLTSLETSIDNHLKGTKRLFSRNMMQSISRLGLKFNLMPISSKTNEGFLDVNAYLERILVGGNKYTY